MLTEKEREWLTVRKKACARCGKVPSRCSQDQRNACYRAGFPLWDKTTVTFESYRDAAEFEARVAEKLTLKEPCPLPENADLDDCPYFTEDDGSAFSCRWCRLKRARIAVEEEMDECLSPRL